MPKPITDRIAELKERKDKLAAKLTTLESKAKKENRKRDTRRKIIVGGAVLSYMEQDQNFAAWLRSMLTHYVGRTHDRNVIADLLPPPFAESAEASVNAEAPLSSAE